MRRWLVGVLLLAATARAHRQPGHGVPPGPPSVTLAPLDSKIRVDLAPAPEDDADDVTHFFVDLAVDPLDGGVASWRNVGGEVGTRFTITGLDNGVRYLVRGIAIDEAGCGGSIGGLLVSALAGRGRRRR